MIELFIFGTIFGITITICGSLIYSLEQEHIMFVKPLNTFIDKPLSEWSFIQRVGDIVQISVSEYTVNCNLDDKSVSIFEGTKATIIETKLNSKKLKHIYDRVERGFSKEIFTDVVDINGVFLSNNIIPQDPEGNTIVETYEHTPTMDDILDKISKVGLDNLTQREKEILKKYGED